MSCNATRIFHYNYVLLINNDSDNNNYCFMVKRISVYVINNCVFRQRLCVVHCACMTIHYNRAA